LRSGKNVAIITVFCNKAYYPAFVEEKTQNNKNTNSAEFELNSLIRIREGWRFIVLISQFNRLSSTRQIYIFSVNIYRDGWR
jgi:hypothetical protein